MSTNSKPPKRSKNLSHRQKVEVKNWRKGLGQKWPHLTKEEINAANPDTAYRSAEAVKATVRVPKNVEISINTPKSEPISRIIGDKPLFTEYDDTPRAPSYYKIPKNLRGLTPRETRKRETIKRQVVKWESPEQKRIEARARKIEERARKIEERVRKNVEISRNTPVDTPISRIIGNKPFFTEYDDKISNVRTNQPIGKPLSILLPKPGDEYHPKSTFTPSNVDLNSRRVLDPNGSHISKQQIDADVAKQTEDFTNNRRKNMPFIKSLFAKKYDTKADELTAAYSGFKTNLFDKPVLDAEGNRVVRPQATIFPPNKRTPVLSSSGNPVLKPDGTPVTKSTGERFDRYTGELHGAKTPWLDQKSSPITGLAGVQEDVLKSELPEQLRGVSNLQNEEDLFKFRAAYDQDLINDRLGKKANYVDLTDDDIFQSSTRSTNLNEGDLFSSKGAAGGYGWAEHRMYSGTLTNLNPRSLKYGYGMGWGNAWRASSKDHLKRGVAVVSPLSRGNLSAMGEMLGRVTTRDLLNFKANPSMYNRLTNVLPSGGVAVLLGYGMMEMQDPSELMINWLAPAAAIYGGRVGVALGGALTPAKTAANWGLLRGAGLAVGSTLGFVTGLTAASLVGMGISSAMTNDSSVRKFANSLNKIEIYSPQIDNRQTLTARQQALNKLSRSGLNDRALLLGNEAAALRGLI